jgi:hypothetical protein
MTQRHHLKSWLKVCRKVSCSGTATSRNMKGEGGKKIKIKDGEQQNLP